MVGDLAGFVAATFMRGVPYVQVPTTLLAMIDASVGGKTGVDTPAGKNLVGAFHQPAAVVADTERARPRCRSEQLRAGLAEAIKHGVIADADVLRSRARRRARGLATLDVRGEQMLDLVARSVEIKADVVGRDEREAGVRKTLNFGHTIGHAIELCSGYTLLHGEAVAIGMVYESALAERLGRRRAGHGGARARRGRAAGLPDARPASIGVDDDSRRGARRQEGARRTRRVCAAGAIGAMAGANRGWAMPVSDAAVREVLA